jgi:anaerobic selenocysteine-containing dehydrogenase
MYDRLNHARDPLAPEDGFYLGNEYRLDIDRRHTLEEIYDRQIRSWKHNKKGWGLKELRDAGFHEHRVSRKEFYNYYWMPGSQTRHPIYFEHLKAVGDELRRSLEKHGISMPGVEDADHVFDLYRAIPHWVENSEFKAPEEYDLWAFNWRTLFFSNDQSHLTANPWLAEFFEKDRTDGTICMNEKTAKKKGLEEGDLAVVESRYGKVEGRVHLSELFHEDSVGISGCYRLGTLQTNPQGRKGPHFNSLLPMDDKTLDGVSAGVEIAPRVKVYKKAMS